MPKKSEITEIINGLNSLLKKNPAEQKKACDDFLARYQENDKSSALKLALKNLGISFTGEENVQLMTPPLYTQEGMRPADFAPYFNGKLYPFAYALSALGYLFEQNGTPEEHATKLAVMFTNPKDLLAYLTHYVTDYTNSLYPIHDACLFTLPDFTQAGFLDKVTGCKFEEFRKIAQTDKNLLKKDFRELLPFAWEVQELVKKNQPAIALSVAEKSEQASQIHKAVEEIKKNQKEYNELERHKVKLTQKEEIRYAALALELSQNLRDLAHLSRGKKLAELSFLELKGFYEEYKFNMDISYQTFIKNGIPPKFYDIFKELNRQKAGEHIPDVRLDGATLGYPGYYFMKVLVQDEQQAARAACFGKLTNSCQSLSGENGQPCVIHGLTSPEGGFYTLCQGDYHHPQVTDTLIAQSWVWRSQANALVLDSVEVAPSVHYDENLKKMVCDFYEYIGRQLVLDKQTVKVTCGKQSGISSRVGILATSEECESCQDYTQYRDSYTQRIIYDSTKPYYFYNQYEECKIKTQQLITQAALSTESLGKNKFFSQLVNWTLLESDPYLKIVLTNKKDIFDEIKKIFDDNEKINEFMAGIEDYIMADNKLDPGLLVNLSYVDTIDSSERTPLILAALGGLNELCNTFIGYGANVNAKDSRGRTPLIHAAMQGHSQVCLVLIKNGADINAKDNTGWTALMHAARAGHSQVCLVLIENGADINAKDNTGMTVLMYAAKNGMADVCSKLIEVGAQVNAKDNGGATALMRAAFNGERDICLKLIENKVDINAKNNTGWTALRCAIEQGDANVCLNLIEKGAAVSEDILSKLKEMKDPEIDIALAKLASLRDKNEPTIRPQPLVQTLDKKPTLTDNTQKALVPKQGPKLKQIK